MRVKSSYSARTARRIESATLRSVGPELGKRERSRLCWRLVIELLAALSGIVAGMRPVDTAY